MNKNKKYMFLGLVILGAVLLIINGFTYARYASNSIWNYYLKSKGFYFDSDDLGINGTKNINNMWDGGNVYFTITNSLNASVATEYNINYEVTCTIEGDDALNNKCYMYGQETNKYTGVLSKYIGCINNTGNGVDVSSYNQTTCEINGYNWKVQPAYKELYFTVVNNNGQIVNDVTVNITASSTSPYVKSLTGTFILHRTVSNNGDVSLKYNDHQDYSSLIVSNSYNEPRCVHISWDDDNLSIDTNKDELVSYNTNSKGFINDIRFNLTGKNSVEYIFYKKNIDAVINDASFMIEDNNAC